LRVFFEGTGKHGHCRIGFFFCSRSFCVANRCCILLGAICSSNAFCRARDLPGGRSFRGQKLPIEIVGREKPGQKNGHSQSVYRKKNTRTHALIGFGNLLSSQDTNGGGGRRCSAETGTKKKKHPFGLGLSGRPLNKSWSGGASFATALAGGD